MEFDFKILLECIPSMISLILIGMTLINYSHQKKQQKEIDYLNKKVYELQHEINSNNNKIKNNSPE